MLHISKESNQSSGKVLQAAITFFGPRGVGLDLQSQSTGSLQFVGGGGNVLIQVAPTDFGSEVDIQTQEFEYQVEQFMQEV